MAKAYRAVVRDQPLLLPVDMREWLPRDHQVWLLIEVVEQHLDTSAFHRGRRLGGAGRAGYDPDMLLTVLIWAYAQGERSSRRIERACQQDLAYRVICGGNLPDHTTIARFRAEFAEAVTELFAQVLQLCARLGMVNLATITLDGTKVRGNASMGANRGLDWLEHHAAAAVAEHAAADASEDDLFGPGRRGDAVPTDLQPDPTDTDPTDPTDTSGGGGGGDGGGGGGALTPARARGQAGRAARIREALEQVGTAVQERTQAQQATADAYLERVRAGQKAPGRIPAGLELAAAQTRLDRILAEQEAKLAAWHDWSPYRTHRLRGHRPKVDDYFQVVQLRAQIERLQARQPTPNTSTSGQGGDGQGGDGQGGDGQGGDGQGGDGEKTSADKADRRGPVRNITDTASRVMPTRNGFIQGYNAQMSGDGLMCRSVYDLTCRSRWGDHGMGSPPVRRSRRSLSR